MTFIRAIGPPALTADGIQEAMVTKLVQSVLGRYGTDSGQLSVAFHFYGNSPSLDDQDIKRRRLRRPDY